MVQPPRWWLSIDTEAMCLDRCGEDADRPFSHGLTERLLPECPRSSISIQFRKHESETPVVPQTRPVLQAPLLPANGRRAHDPPLIDGDLAGELDFERAENLATERTTPGLARSQADMLWKIHFRGSSRHLLLQVEFQSATDRYMCVRALCYVALAYDALISARGRRKTLAPGGLLPPALAVTVYNGRQRWTAPDDIFDLIEPVRGWLAGHQPRLRHQVLDLRALARQPQTAAALSNEK